jgi:hypothetical protein
MGQERSRPAVQHPALDDRTGQASRLHQPGEPDEILLSDRVGLGVSVDGPVRLGQAPPST